jgi:hypothetical protein
MMGWLFRYAIGRKIVCCLVPQGLLHAGLIKAPGVGYMMVPERIQLGVLDKVLCMYYKATRHGPVFGSAISSCVQYRRGLPATGPPGRRICHTTLMGHPGLLV